MLVTSDARENQTTGGNTEFKKGTTLAGCGNGRKGWGQHKQTSNMDKKL